LDVPWILQIRVKKIIDSIQNLITIIFILVGFLTSFYTSLKCSKLIEVSFRGVFESIVIVYMSSLSRANVISMVDGTPVLNIGSIGISVTLSVIWFESYDVIRIIINWNTN